MKTPIKKPQLQDQTNKEKTNTQKPAEQKKIADKQTNKQTKTS